MAISKLAVTDFMLPTLAQPARLQPQVQPSAKGNTAATTAKTAGAAAGGRTQAQTSEVVREGTGAESSAPAPSFAERVGQALGTVDAAGVQAEHAATEMAAGRSDDIHGTMLAMRQADVRFRLLATSRNRVLEAYHEVMRMGA